jgi:hypothetical protein
MIQRGQRENQRQLHGPHFTVAPIEGGFEILYAGALFATIEVEPRLPAGFVDRFVQHAMDLLRGRRSGLWDEQAQYGEKPFALDDARTRAFDLADQDAKDREQ